MVLTQCPGVKDCAVFGIPDDDFGELLAAVAERMPESQVTPERSWSASSRTPAKSGAACWIDSRIAAARGSGDLQAPLAPTRSGRTPGARFEGRHGQGLQSNEHLTFEVRERVARITLNWPDRRNALSEMLSELRAALLEADDLRAQRDRAWRRRF